jgi:hypothetical protein
VNLQGLTIISAMLVLLGAGGAVRAADPQQWLQRLDDYPHAVTVDSSSTAVVDHLIGLDSLRKVRGVWQFQESERLSGQLTRHTWQIVDGFSSIEVMTELEDMLADQGEGSELMFACDGRACGKGVQWANRIFGQRVLYGREDLQRYRVYRFSNDTDYRLLMYAAARTADRQYLHVELLHITAPEVSNAP